MRASPTSHLTECYFNSVKFRSIVSFLTKCLSSFSFLPNDLVIITTPRVMKKFNSFATSVRTHTQHAPLGTPEHVWIRHHKNKGTQRTKPRLIHCIFFCCCCYILTFDFNSNVWSQRISIPPPWREYLESSEGLRWGSMT